MIKNLIQIANELDRRGLGKEADVLDALLKNALLLDLAPGGQSGEFTPDEKDVLRQELMKRLELSSPQQAHETLEGVNKLNLVEKLAPWADELMKEETSEDLERLCPDSERVGGRLSACEFALLAAADKNTGPYKLTLDRISSLQTAGFQISSLTDEEKRIIGEMADA